MTQSGHSYSERKPPVPGNGIIKMSTEAENDYSQNAAAVSNNSIGSLLFSFKGRIGRGTFWAIFIIHILIMLLLMIAFVNAPEKRDAQDWLVRLGQDLLATFAAIYLPIATWIAFATFAKRWHDVGMSGWMTLWQFIPVANIGAFLVLGITPGNKGSNKYGEEPQ